MTSPLQTPPVASAGKRIAGFIADILILTALAFVLVPLTGSSFDEADSLDPTSAFSIANLVVLAVYQVGFIAVLGQTPGKMMVATKVIDVDTQAIPGLSAAMARFALPAAAGFLPGGGSLIAIVIYGWILGDKRNQGLHDKLAHTVVVDLGSGAERTARERDHMPPRGR